MMKMIKEQNIVKLSDGGIGVQGEDVKRGEVVRSSSVSKHGDVYMCGVYKVGNPIIKGGTLRRLTRLGARPEDEC